MRSAECVCVFIYVGLNSAERTRPLFRIHARASKHSCLYCPSRLRPCLCVWAYGRAEPLNVILANDLRRCCWHRSSPLTTRFQDHSGTQRLAYFFLDLYACICSTSGADHVIEFRRASLETPKSLLTATVCTHDRNGDRRGSETTWDRTTENKENKAVDAENINTILVAW